MDHDYRPPPASIRQAEAARLTTDLILECERAASRRNPRDCDPRAMEQDRMAALPLRRRPRPKPHGLGIALRAGLPAHAR